MEGERKAGGEVPRLERKYRFDFSFSTDRRLFETNAEDRNEPWEYSLDETDETLETIFEIIRIACNH